MHEVSEMMYVLRVNGYQIIVLRTSLVIKEIIITLESYVLLWSFLPFCCFASYRCLQIKGQEFSDS